MCQFLDSLLPRKGNALGLGPLQQLGSDPHLQRITRGARGAGHLLAAFVILQIFDTDDPSTPQNPAAL